MQPFRGTYDLLPSLFAEHKAVIDAACRTAGLYGFQQIDTPIFEYAGVFLHTLGETSDVVTKEMFTLMDRHGDLLALRPEGTAGVMRAVLSNNLYQGNPLKFFYSGPMFRYERPQKGRTRQFHQIGVETIGDANPCADVETIMLGWQILKTLGLEQSVQLELNTLGDEESRNLYREALVKYFQKHEKELSLESQIRLQKNPLRILDSKDPQDQEFVGEAPKMKKFLTSDSLKFFEAVQEGLEKINVPYHLNDRLVRGLDYYCHTAFEFTTTLLGSQNAVLAGGRYNGLSQKLGGPSLPSVGWAAGIERLAMLAEQAIAVVRPISLIPLGDVAQEQAFKMLFDLRSKQMAVDLAWEGSLKSRMKRANRLNAKWAFIFGDDELKQNTVTVKDLDSGDQTTVPLENVESFIKAS
ncbi:MAG: histidine--tRNA ligase [Alphaproteobacteria bacterium]